MRQAWEKIDDSSDRLRVPGGWIVRSHLEQSWDGGASVHQLMVFDTHHRWRLDDEDSTKIPTTREGQ